MLKIETTTIYLIALASIATILILSHLFRLAGSLVYRSALSWFYKLFMHTEVFRRRKSTDSISVLSFCYICVYIGANVALCAVGINSRRALAKRCGTLCLVNLIPLSLGGRLSFLTHALSRVRPWNQSLAHRWIGRVCLLQGACHGILGMLVERATTVQILLLSTIAAIVLLSLLQIRQHIYESFLRTHLSLGLFLVGLLWYHIPIEEARAIACLISTSALWLLQQTAWLCYFVYRNIGARESFIRHVSCDRNNAKSRIMKITVYTEISRQIRPGHYAYLTFPRLAGYPLSLFQAHPHVVAWKDGFDCTFLIQRESGISRHMFNVLQPGPRVLVDGPYGQVQSFEGYEKVLFVASGIGVAAYFLSIKALIEAEIAKATCVRRISLAWLVETPDQEAWVQEFFDSLDRLNGQRRAFTRTLFIPSSPGAAVHHVAMSTARLDTVMDMSRQVWGEHEQEPGNMLVVSCGTPHFEKTLTSAIRKSPWPSQSRIGKANDVESGPSGSVDLQYASFRPEETTTSRSTWPRYRVGQYNPGVSGR